MVPKHYQVLCAFLIRAFSNFPNWLGHFVPVNAATQLVFQEYFFRYSLGREKIQVDISGSLSEQASGCTDGELQDRLQLVGIQYSTVPTI